MFLLPIGPTQTGDTSILPTQAGKTAPNSGFADIFSQLSEERPDGKGAPLILPEEEEGARVTDDPDQRELQPGNVTDAEDAEDEFVMHVQKPDRQLPEEGRSLPMADDAPVPWSAVPQGALDPKKQAAMLQAAMQRMAVDREGAAIGPSGSTSPRDATPVSFVRMTVPLAPDGVRTDFGWPVAKPDVTHGPRQDPAPEMIPEPTDPITKPSHIETENQPRLPSDFLRTTHSLPGPMPPSVPGMPDHRPTRPDLGSSEGPKTGLRDGDLSKVTGPSSEIPVVPAPVLSSGQAAVQSATQQGGRIAQTSAGLPDVRSEKPDQVLTTQTGGPSAPLGVTPAERFADQPQFRRSAPAVDAPPSPRPGGTSEAVAAAAKPQARAGSDNTYAVASETPTRPLGLAPDEQGRTAVALDRAIPAVRNVSNPDLNVSGGSASPQTPQTLPTDALPGREAFSTLDGQTKPRVELSQSAAVPGQKTDVVTAGRTPETQFTTPSHVVPGSGEARQLPGLHPISAPTSAPQASAPSQAPQVPVPPEPTAEGVAKERPSAAQIPGGFHQSALDQAGSKHGSGPALDPIADSRISGPKPAASNGSAAPSPNVPATPNHPVSDGIAAQPDEVKLRPTETAQRAGPAGGAAPAPAPNAPASANASVAPPMSAHSPAQPVQEDGDLSLTGLPSEAKSTTPSGPVPNAGATPAQAAAHGPIRQIAFAIQGSAERSVELALSPAELGKVRITLTPGETGMNVAIFADRPETLDLMRRHSDQLAQEFTEIGYQSAEFTFGSDGQGDAGEGGQDRSSALHSDTDPNTTVMSGPDSTPQVAAKNGPVSSDGRMDIRF